MAADTPRRRELATLVREAAANWRARPALAVGLALSIAVSIGTLVATEANASTDATRSAERLTSLGWRTLVLEHDDNSPGALESGECERLDRQPGVHSVIWLRDDEPRHLLAPYGPVIPVHGVGGDIGEFVAEIDPRAASGWVAAQTFVDNDSTTAATARTGEYTIRWMVDGSMHDTSALTVELSALGPGTAGNALTVDAAPGPVDSCVVLVDPAQRATVDRTISAAFPALQGFSSRWALAGADEFETSTHRFITRTSQYFWLAAVTMFMVLWWLALRLRRASDAFYSVAGLRPSRISILTITELALTVAVAVASAGVVIVGAAVRSHTPWVPLENGLRSGGRYVVAICCLGAVTAVLAARRTTTSTLEAIKDR